MEATSALAPVVFQINFIKCLGGQRVLKERIEMGETPY